MKTNKKLALVSSIALLQLANSALAATLCVDPNKPACKATIQEAVDFAASGDTIKIAAGAYNQGSPININQNNLTITGAGCSTIIDGCNTSNCDIPSPIAVISGTGVTIQKLAFRHSGNSAIELNNAEKSKIIGNCFYDNAVDIHGSGANNTIISKNSSKGSKQNSMNIQGNKMQVTGNKISNTISVAQFTGSDIEVSGNTFTSCGFNGFSVIGDTAIIQNNKLSFCGSGIDVAGNAADVQKNTIDGGIGGIRVTGDAPNVQNNTLTGVGISVTCTPDEDPNNWDNCNKGAGKIASNKINFTSHFGGTSNLSITGSTLEIENNVLKYASGSGIHFIGNNATIKKNTILNPANQLISDFESGILLEGSSNRIESNKITDAAFNGIRNQSGDSNTYLNNTISTSGRSGLFIKSGGTNTLDGNKALSNSGEGINNQGFGTNVKNNTGKGNRTDFCNDGSVSAFDNNKFGAGDTSTACVVDKNI